MKKQQLTLAIVLCISLLAASGQTSAQDYAIENIPVSDANSPADYSRLLSLVEEFNVRLKELERGANPVSALVQTNKRLLTQTLSMNVPHAGLEFERRAAKIVQIAEKNLETGVGTVENISEAREADLDSMLKRLLLTHRANNL